MTIFENYLEREIDALGAPGNGASVAWDAVSEPEINLTGTMEGDPGIRLTASGEGGGAYLRATGDNGTVGIEASGVGGVVNISAVEDVDIEASVGGISISGITNVDIHSEDNIDIGADTVVLISAGTQTVTLGPTPPAAIADASGGSVIDIEARAALNTLLTAVRALGLIAT